MLRKLLRASVIGVSVAVLASCGGQSGAGNGYGMLSDATMSRQSERVARAIERLEGISRADVVIRGSAVYVTVEVNDQAPNNPRFGRTHAKGSSSADTWGQKGNYYGSTDSRVLPTVPGWDHDRLRRMEQARKERTGVTGMRSRERWNRGYSTNKDTIDMYGYGRGSGRNGPQNGPRSMEGYTGMTGPGVDGVSVLNAQIRGQIENVVRTMVQNVDTVYVGTSLDYMDDLSPFQPGGPASNSFDPDNPRHRTGLRVR